MIHRRHSISILMVIVSCLGIGGLSARPNSFAFGLETSLLSAGVLADFESDTQALQLSFEVPFLGDEYDYDDEYGSFHLLSADFAKVYPLSTSFSLKIGLSAVVATDFATNLIGVLGPSVKGEYWIPDHKTGLFCIVRIPLYLFGLGDEIGSSDLMGMSMPGLPLGGLLISSVGVLYSF